MQIQTLKLSKCYNAKVRLDKDANRKGGTESSHRHTRAEGSAFSHIDFHKIQNSSEDTCPNGQQSSFELSGKDSQQEPFQPLQTNMGLSEVEIDHNYCRVPTRSSECDTRLGVP